MKKTVYILTECNGNGENYTPLVFAAKKEAQTAMKEIYRNYLKDYDPNAGTIKADRAFILWDDDTINSLQIYKTEIEI